MRIGLINIGDEILAGKILNTNARDLALWLGELGHELAFMLTVPDGVEELAEPLRRALAGSSDTRCGMLILSGGLGPTHDDFTREALAKYLGVPLERNQDATEWLSRYLDKTPETISEGQAIQLDVPRGVTPLYNPVGTACGLGFTENDCAVFAFPGVPREFRTLFDLHCRPLLERRDAVLLRRRAITFGLSESKQRDFLRNFVLPPSFRYSSLPNATGVTIAMETYASAAEEEHLRDALETSWNELLSLLPSECIVSRDGTPLVDTVVQLLRTHNATVSVAESCTGGLVGHLITSVPGSSAVFERGFLTYSNDAKHELLGVPETTLQTHGAVSEETAHAMATGCLQAARSDYAVSVTGIAGPDGGTAEKPVGLVYVGVASARTGRVDVAHIIYRGQDREGNRRLSAYKALNQLRLSILKDFEQKTGETAAQ